MSFRIRGELQGMEEVQRSMRELKGPVRRRVLRSGMRKLASLMNKAAKAMIAVGLTKQLKRSLGVKVKVYPSGVVVGIVEPREGFRVVVRVSRSGKVIYHDPARIAHLAERGTKPRRTKRGWNRGAARAHPAVLPAFELNAPRAEAIFAAELDKELAKL